MSTHANAVGMTVTGAPGTGAITLNAAAAGGARTFLAAFGAVSTTVDVVYEDPAGTFVGCERGAVYNGGSPGTITRGTPETPGSLVTLTSAAVVRVAATADWGNRLEQQLSRGFTSVANNSSTTQTTSSNAQVQISTALTTVIEDPLSWWDSTNKRFQPTRSGTYLVWGGVQFDASATGLIQAFIRKNGTTNVMTGETNAAAAYYVCAISGAVALNGSSDYLTLEVYTGSAITTNPSGNAPYFQAVFLG